MDSCWNKVFFSFFFEKDQRYCVTVKWFMDILWLVKIFNEHVHIDLNNDVINLAPKSDLYSLMSQNFSIQIHTGTHIYNNRNHNYISVAYNSTRSLSKLVRLVGKKSLETIVFKVLTKCITTLHSILYGGVHNWNSETCARIILLAHWRVYFANLCLIS